MLTHAIAALLSVAVGQIDELGIVRIDPAAKGVPAGLELYSLSGSGFGVFEGATRSDPKIGKTTGKKVVRFVFGADTTGDGVDEVVIATERTAENSRPLEVKIYAAPKVPNGDLGKPLASLKKGALKMAGVNRVLCMSAGDWDADGKDELMVVRVPSFGEERLEIFRMPVGANKPLGAVLASDWTFGPPGEDNVAICCGDADADGKDDIVSVRRALGGPDRLFVQRMPIVPIAEGELLGSDASIDAPDGATLVSMFAIQKSGPIGFQLGFLRRDLTTLGNPSRIDVFGLPASAGGDIGAPLATQGPLDGESVGDPVYAALSVRHNQPLPWAGFEGVLKVYLHVAYPIDVNGVPTIVDSWMNPLAEISGDGNTTWGLELKAIAPSLGTAKATVSAWTAGSNVSIDPYWNTVQLEIKTANYPAAAGERALFTFQQGTVIEQAGSKLRLRYTNPGGPINGTPIGEVQFYDNDNGVWDARASIMEYYVEKL